MGSVAHAGRNERCHFPEVIGDLTGTATAEEGSSYKIHTQEINSKAAVMKEATQPEQTQHTPPYYFVSSALYSIHM